MKLFFLGIGGSGVSAIASFMKDKDHNVSGSDRGVTDSFSRIFKAKGISIVPQDGSGIDKSIDLVVASTAVEPGNPDLEKAKTLGLPIKTRPEFLSDIVGSFKSIAVAGTSGKSTTSGLLAFLMKRLGLEPNFIGGGRVKRLKGNTNPGNALSGKSDYLVVEACESDGSIVSYRPLHTVLLNLQLDHHPVEKTRAMFVELVKNTSGETIINADDANLKGIAGIGSIMFSIDAPSRIRAIDVSGAGLTSEFSVDGIRFRLSIPGRHNVYNALAAIASLSALDIPLKDIAGVLPEFDGIERRFDIHLNGREGLVIDDYAHNPHKIEALMKTVSAVSKSVCYIFQPHGYGPTRLMKDGYIGTFSEHMRDSDCLLLLPIYYAGGTATKDISSEDLAVGIRGLGKSAVAVSERGEIFGLIDGKRAVVVMGARDESLSLLAGQIAAAFRR